MSCLVSTGSNWLWLENDWQEHLERKKVQLRAQGRRVFDRYHAADCANLKNDFDKKHGWTRTEEHEFSAPLHDLFRKYPTAGYAITVPLKEMVEIIPESAPNPEGFACVILLQILMMRLCDDLLRRVYPDAILGLVHDRGNYDAAMLEAFNQMLGDENFKCQHRFTTLAPMGWEHCVALQPADLFAYEAFKEAERQYKALPHNPRYSLLRCFGEGSKWGGNGGLLQGDALRELKKSFDSLDDSVKGIVLATARVSTKRKPMNPKNTEFEKFDAVVRKVFAVSHAEIVKREKVYKQKRKRAKQKRAKASPASRASGGKD